MNLTTTLVDLLTDGVGTNLNAQLNGPSYQSQTLSPTRINLNVTVAQVGEVDKYFIDGVAQRIGTSKVTPTGLTSRMRATLLIHLG